MERSVFGTLALYRVSHNFVIAKVSVSKLPFLEFIDHLVLSSDVFECLVKFDLKLSDLSLKELGLISTIGSAHLA